MKTNASDYFNSISPVKTEVNKNGSNGSFDNQVKSSRSGRCHCCPYGYHIDLDFVRYCDNITQGSKNETPTLRQLKKLKKARRRQTKSMEVLLGLPEFDQNQESSSNAKLDIIEESRQRKSATVVPPSKVAPEPPPRKQSLGITSPPPDVIRTTEITLNNIKLNDIQRQDGNQVNQALHEAMLDFEETFESSTLNDPNHQSRYQPSTIPSLDLLHHTPQHHTYNAGSSSVSQNHNFYENNKKKTSFTGPSVARSNSLPRQWVDGAPHPAQLALAKVLKRSLSFTGQSRNHASVSRWIRGHQESFISDNSTPVPNFGRQHRTNSNSSLNGGHNNFYNMTNNTYTNQYSHTLPSYYNNANNHVSSSQINDTMAVLNAARGYSQAQSQDMDVLSIASGMSGVSTSTLQSIRDQVSTGLDRLKDLEEEVKTIPMLQIKLNLLKEEKKLLLHHIKTTKTKGQDDNSNFLLLPPSIDADLTDVSEDELDIRLSSLRRSRRRRSESPMRVNLEEFKSHQRRRGSISEGSEADTSAPQDCSRLFISEGLEQNSTGKNVSSNRMSQSTPVTPSLNRKAQRDVGTSCRVITRDVGTSHIPTRSRSIGSSTEGLDFVMKESKKEIKAKPCMVCYTRNKKSFNDKSVGTPAVVFDVPETVAKEAIQPSSPRNSLLEKLGKKSSIISRLSEPQALPPVLTFDNSTNTENPLVQSKGIGTILHYNDFITPDEVDEILRNAKLKWEHENRKMKFITRDQRIGTDILGNDVITLDQAEQMVEEAKKLLEEKIMLETPIDAAKVTFDKGIQTVTIAPKCHNVGVMVKSSTHDIGVGLHSITDVLCEKCSSIRTRSIGTGDCSLMDITCDKCSSTKTKSIGVGDNKLTDVWCQNCLAIPTIQSKSVGCGIARIDDRICDKCDNTKYKNAAVGDGRITDINCQSCKQRKLSTSVSIQTTPEKIEIKRKDSSMQTIPDLKTSSSSSAQTQMVEQCTKGINTMTLPLLKKEESFNSSPVLTPELERKAFGSAGIRVCDKCHETITSLALDVVNTTGSAGASIIPSAPPVAISRIPRLRDVHKSEGVNVDLNKSNVGHIMSSGSTSLSETQLSSLSNSFTENKFNHHINIQQDFKPQIKPLDSSPSKVIRGFNTDSKLNLQSSQKISTSTKPDVISSVFSTKKIEKLSESKSSPEKAKVTNDLSSVKSSPTKISKAIEPMASSIPSITVSSDTDKKKVPYQRQDTYTKLEIDAVSSNEKDSLKKSSISEQVLEKENKDEESDGASTQPIIEGHEEAATTESSPLCSEFEDSGDEATSIITNSSLATSTHTSFDNESTVAASGSSTYLPSGERKKAHPSRAMKAALKVLNDSIGKPVRSGQQLTNAINIVQKEWFKISGQKDADPHVVEDYMDSFEDFSHRLLLRVVNLHDVNGNTAMHYAVSHGNFDVVSVLLDSKVCNVNQQNKAGYTAVMLVSLAQICNETHSSVVQRLFQLGDVNIKASQHGQTALMLAVSHGRADMVRLLVAAGADINIQDEDGSTALMCAAEHGHLAIVKFLAAQPDADLSLTDHDGSHALAIAVEAGHKDVGVLLYKHMNLSRGSSPHSSMRIKRSRTPTMTNRSPMTPPPRSSAPSSPGRSRKSSGAASPAQSRNNSASLSNLIL